MQLKPEQQNKKEPTVSYEFIELKAGDMEYRLNKAFDILFTEVFKNNDGVDKYD